MHSDVLVENLVTPIASFCKKYRLVAHGCWHLHEPEALLDEPEDDSRDGGTSTVALLRGPLFGVGLRRQFSMLPFLPGTLPQI